MLIHSAANFPRMEGHTLSLFVLFYRQPGLYGAQIVSEASLLYNGLMNEYKERMQLYGGHNRS